MGNCGSQVSPQTPQEADTVEVSILHQTGVRQASKAFFFEQDGGRRRARNAQPLMSVGGRVLSLHGGKGPVCPGFQKGDTKSRRDGPVLDLTEKFNRKEDSTRMLKEIISICPPPRFSGELKAKQTVMQKEPVRVGQQVSERALAQKETVKTRWTPSHQEKDWGRLGDEDAGRS